MYRFILYRAMLVMLAAPAWGVDTTKYPSTLVDSTCTDTEDTPAATTLGAVGFGGYIPAPTVQLTGSADGYCDHDSRILASSTAIVADTTFGPFSGKGIKGFILYADGDAVTGGDTNYHIDIGVKKPHDGVVIEIDVGDDKTANGNVTFSFGTDVGTPSQGGDRTLVPLANTFYIILDIDTADSWAGDISLIPWRD